MKTTAQNQVQDQLVYLRRRFRPRARPISRLVSVAPLVNLALLLFLFYVANSRFVLQPGIVVDLPVASFESGTQIGPMVVTVSQEGLVFFNDERTTLDGLEAAFAQAVHEHPGASLVIEADGRVQHNTLVNIYNMAMAAGIRQVALATRIQTAGPAIP